MRTLALTAALASTTAAAFCPCYTLTSTNNTANCGVEAAPGTNPTPTQWQAIFQVVSGGPASWGTSGPAVSNIGQGCGKPMPPTTVAARFPCELLKAIAMTESSWKQFCVPDSPADQVGGVSRTIIAFDCGYGIGQVTSGMHIGENPSFDRLRVASDPTYNLATGTQILAAKWKATNCVGDNQPSLIEDWYTATWAYNGLAYSNNPSNPAFSATRGVWNPNVGGSAPYQEKVFGWMEHPPSASYWSVTAVAYPNPAGVGGTGSPPALPEPTCASPTNCTATRTVHTSACFLTDGGTPDAGPPPTDAGKPDSGTATDAGATDSGAPDSGSSDAGSAGPDAGNSDAGGNNGGDGGGGGLPTVLSRANENLGPAEAAGCGCGVSAGAPLSALAVLVLLRRRQNRR